MKNENRVRGYNYICPICENEEHPVNAKFCKICGTAIFDSQNCNCETCGIKKDGDTEHCLGYRERAKQ